MRRIDEQYLKTPFYGSRRMAVTLSGPEEPVNRKRVQRLMRVMGIEALHPEAADDDRGGGGEGLPLPAPRSGADPGRRGLEFGHHLCADEARVHVPDGGDRLVQPLRAVVAAVEHAGRGFCLEALDEALSRGRPEIFNTDQGSQFTSREYTGRLEEAGVAVSRDGRGRALDNVFVERLWRSVKYEDIYIKDYERVFELESGLTAYFRFYDEDRPHQSLDYRTPGEVYRAGVRGAAERGRIITNTGPRAVQYLGSMGVRKVMSARPRSRLHFRDERQRLACGIGTSSPSRRPTRPGGVLGRGGRRVPRRRSPLGAALGRRISRGGWGGPGRPACGGPAAQVDPHPGEDHPPLVGRQADRARLRDRSLDRAEAGPHDPPGVRRRDSTRST